MKKYLLVLFAILFLTGCSATYEITLNSDGINEKLVLIETNTALFDVKNDSGWTLREIFESLLSGDEFSDEDYNIKSLNNNSRLGVEYSSEETKELINSAILNQCYINPKMTEENGIVTINTGDNFKCYEYYENLDTIRIVLKTNFEVVSSNADEVVNNKYIWNITKDSDKQIQFIYNKNVIKQNNLIFIIIGIVMVVVIGFGIYYIIEKRKRENTL